MKHLRSALTTLLTSLAAAALLLAPGCAVEEAVTADELAVSTAGRSLTLVMDHFKVGEGNLLPLEWHAPPDHDEWEQIRMYRAGSNDDDYIAYAWVGGLHETTGTVAWRIPQDWAVDPRPLQFRYFDRFGRDKFATSGHMTLGFNYDVSISPDNPERNGRAVTVGWHAPLLHGGTDTIRMYKVGARNEDWLAARFIEGTNRRDGSVTFTLPPASEDPGPYEFRLFYGVTQLYVMDVSEPVFSPE